MSQICKSQKEQGAYVSPPIIHLDYSFNTTAFKLKGKEVIPDIYKKHLIFLLSCRLRDTAIMYLNNTRKDFSNSML